MMAQKFLTRRIFLFASLMVAANDADAEQPIAPAPVVRQIEAPEARQGVASGGAFVYAIDNSAIGKYRVDDERKVAEWRGDPALFPHLNSCAVVRKELVCAASNYPQVPQTSSIEFFDAESLHHARSVSLGMMPGSLTVITRHEGHWWAVFANYDGKGGEPGRDHRYTLLARLDDAFRIERSWAFPAEILAAFAPKSCSGAAWGRDGRLYVSGHDKPEIYALELPAAGSTLQHVATIAVTTPGQAIDWDKDRPNILWSIDRTTRSMVASDLTNMRPWRGMRPS